ncbi:MAG: DUF167 domain-containing protein [Deltaproteobacteria bacterium]|nr:DUF167 domain-containing protein [Deltaproteobacteria bacterium]
MTRPCLKQTGQGVELSVLVLPRSSKNRLVGMHGDELKIKLTSPPVEGAANRECEIFLAKLCRLPRNRVKLLQGESSRHKRWLLSGVELEPIRNLLNSRLGA